MSGGQRIHHAPLLEERMKACGVDPETMIDYVNGFRWGCPPVSILFIRRSLSLQAQIRLAVLPRLVDPPLFLRSRYQWPQTLTVFM